MQVNAPLNLCQFHFVKRQCNRSHIQTQNKQCELKFQPCKILSKFLNETRKQEQQQPFLILCMHYFRIVSCWPIDSLMVRHIFLSHFLSCTKRSTYSVFNILYLSMLTSITNKKRFCISCRRTTRVLTQPNMEKGVNICTYK